MLRSKRVLVTKRSTGCLPGTGLIVRCNSALSVMTPCAQTGWCGLRSVGFSRYYLLMPILFAACASGLNAQRWEPGVGRASRPS